MVTARIRDMILDWHDKGISVDETANVLKLPENQISDIIKAGHPHQTSRHPTPGTTGIRHLTNHSNHEHRQSRTLMAVPALAG